MTFSTSKPSAPPGRHWWKSVLLLLAAVLVAGLPVQAQGQASIEIHHRDTYAPLPLLTIKSRTVIEGPVAKTRIEYLAENNNEKPIEATVNLHVPQKTVLTGFGYYYGDRFIPGEMYDKGEAWKIYTAVTSRGRDPGIMDRPTAQEYHAQIFPVAPKQDLRIVIELVQMLTTDRVGAHFELPLTQYAADQSQQGASREVSVDAAVLVRDHQVADLTHNFRASKDEEGGKGEAALTHSQNNEGATIRFRRKYTPTENWVVTIQRETFQVARSVYSRMVGPNEGFYALAISAPKDLKNPRIRLRSRPGTSLSMPTRFEYTEAYEDLHVVGRYTGPGRLYGTVYSDNAPPIKLRIDLSGERAESDADNPAAALWADRRIDALKQSNRRDFSKDIIRLSKRFMVVSPLTALLAIPAEELEYYRKVLAKQQVQTNTRWTGGGGGDPYIAVKAPADAQQVVAVFPTGEVKHLTYDPAKQSWTGQFDLPFGTPAGEYRVTVIVVHRDGHRSRFVLVYENLLDAPLVASSLPRSLRARPGEPLRIRVSSGSGTRRVVAVTPWGERVNLSAKSGPWQGTVTVPTSWTPGKALLTLIFLDGAHNRTEVTIDLDVHN